MVSSIGCRVRHVVASLVLFALSAAAQADDPLISPNVPSESFLGEQFCFVANFTNTDAPGYGPYIRLELPPTLSFDSAEIFDSPLTPVLNAIFPGVPPATGTLYDPLFLPASGNDVDGPAGHRLVILRLPVGSVATGGPPLETTICLTISEDAEVGIPIDVEMTPLYQFGDTPTGVNGTELGDTVTQPVTPTVLLFEKTNTAPESERPPGAIWPYEYLLTANIANSATINPLVFSDTLPADVQFVGPITVTGGAGCSVTTTPSTVMPGGNLVVTCSGDTVGTTSDADVVVQVPVHIIDTLDEGNCVVEPQVNDAALIGTYVPEIGPALPLGALPGTSEVAAKHVAVQKTVTPGIGDPDAGVTYTLELQTSQFGTTSTLTLLDVLPDGIDFGAHVSLDVGGSPVAIVPTHVAGNNDTVAYDITAVTGNIPPGTAITVVYTGTVQQEYAASGDPVLAADALTNTVEATYALTGGAAGCNDGSAATFVVDPVSIVKTLLSPQPSYAPGDTVTFRLEMSIPSGDTQNVVFRDFLPLPVFDVNDVDPSFPGPDLQLAPTDTMGLIPVVTVDPATNALIMTFPDIDTADPQVVAVDVSVRVQPDAFADNLFLTNIFRATSSNSANEEAAENAPVQLQVRSPALHMTKGVLSTGGSGTIAPLPGVLPDGNLTGADGNDLVTFRLTIENIGGAPAYDVVVTDPTPAGLTGCSATAQLGNGSPLTTSGTLATGLTLENGAAANPVLAPNAGLGAPYGADTAFVDIACTVSPTVLPNNAVITNSASATWKPQPAGTPGVETFPPISDTATVQTRVPTLAKSVVATSEASTLTNNVAVGEIVRYRLAVNLPEGEIPDMRVFDVLPLGLLFLNDGTARATFVASATNTVSSSTLAIPTVIGTAATAATTPLTFVLPPASIQLGSGTLTCAAGAFVEGSDICFRLGTVTNGDNDGGVGTPNAEFLVIEFNALVLNVSSNQAQPATTRNNQFRMGTGATQLGSTTGNVPVIVREPNVSIDKTVAPNSGVQAGATVEYSITIANSNAANTITAFDIAVEDVLPAQLALDTGSISATPTGTVGAFSFSGAGNTLSGTVASLAPGASITIEYEATVLVAAGPGSSILNSADATWTSLPGPTGTGGNPTDSTVTGGAGTTTGERTGSGGVNDYAAGDVAPIGVAPVTLAKSVVATSLGYTADGRVRPAIADLAIGETATFHVTATVPDGTAPSVVISDTLPFANGRMQYVSSSVVSVGLGLAVTTPNPVPIVSDAQLGDLINDTVSYNFGQVVNDPDNDDPATIVIEVVGRLVDHLDNVNGDQLTNNASVQFGPGLSGTAQADLDVVEPLLDIQKSSPTTTGQAGDVAVFTLTVTHLGGSNMQARAPRIVDALPLPPGLALNLGSVTPSTSGVGCVPAPVLTNDSAGNTVDVSADYLPLDCVLTVTYSATLDNNVVVNTFIDNTADLIWHSITPGDPDGPGREYDDSSSHSIRVSSPGMSKSVTSVVPNIGSGQVGVAPDVPIGGVVTWQFDVEFPAGDSLAAIVTDQLPINTVSFDVVSSRIVSVGSGIAGIPATPTPVPGTAGVESDSVIDADLLDDLVTWSLGNLRAAPVAAANRTIRFEVVARVMDTPQTSGGLTVTNTASFTASTVTTPISATSPVDIVEPRLGIAKAITNLDPAHIVQAGDTVDFQITLSHLSPGSTATAFNVLVTDVLPNPGVSFVAGSTAGTCGAVADTTGYPTIEFAFADLTLAEGSCTITYSGLVTNTVMPGTTYDNLASAEWDSLQTPGPGNRHGTTGTVQDEFTVLAPSLVKVVTTTSLGDTTTAQHTALDDLAIGESVTYTLTIGFPQGTTTDAVLLDTMPTGLVAIGAGAVVLGNPGIGTSLPGTGDIAPGGGSVTFDFGTITNPANGNLTDDWIQVTVVARVQDLPANSDTDILTNLAEFSNGTSPDLDDTADVELVEPELALTKSMATTSAAGATITLSLANNGTGPAYDVVLEDVLLHTVWDVGSIAIGVTPPGFTGALDTSVAGQTTVRFTSNTGVALPPAGNAVATINATLEVFPPSPNPVQNSAEVPTHGSVPADPTNDDIRVYDEIDDDAQLGFPDPLVTKTVSNTGTGPGNAFVPGDLVIFSVSVQNTGPVDLTGATLTDVVPDNTTFIPASSNPGWNCPTPDAASICTLTPFNVTAGTTSNFAFAVQIVDPLPAGVTEVANQAFLTAPLLPPTPIPSDDPDPPGDDDETIVPVIASPELNLEKADDVDDGIDIAPGETIVYTLDYENVGNQDATGVELSETVPLNTTYDATNSLPDVWTCAPNGNAGSTCTLAIGNLPVGEPGSARFAVTVIDPVPAGTTEILNEALITNDADNSDDADETTPLDATPGLHIQKDDGGATTTPGGTVAYTLSFWNDGDEDSADVVITETVPANTVFEPSPASDAGWVCLPDGNAGSTCTLDVGTLPGQTPSTNADTVLFAVTVVNPLPAGVELVDNTAVIEDGADNNDEDGDDTPVDAAPDLAMTKTDGDITVVPGDTIVWTLAYGNIGNQDATGVTITETVPQNSTFSPGSSTAGWVCAPDNNAGSTCSFAIGNLAAGADGAVAFAVTVAATLPAGVEAIANAALIADDGDNGDDPDPGNNNPDDDTPVTALPDLDIDKDDGDATTQAGGTIVWTLTYSNLGDQDAAGVVIGDTVPVNTTFNAALSAPTVWTCADGSAAGTLCETTVGTVASGAPAASVTFAVTVDTPLPAGVTQIDNTAVIASDGTGGEGTDPQDEDGDDTPVDAVPDLTLLKSDGDTSSVPGGVVAYSLTYANVGTQDATGVVVSETVPANTTFNAGASTPGWACVDIVAGSACTFAVGNVAAGAAPASVTFAVTVDDTLPDGITEIANAAAVADDGVNGPDPTPGDNGDEDETPIAAGPDLVLVKSDGDAIATAGGVVAYTLAYRNVGTQDATGVEIAETVPANTVFDLAGSTAGWTCADAAPAGTACSFAVGAVAAGDPEASVVFAVRLPDPIPAGIETIANSAAIADDGNNGDDPTPENNVSDDDTPIAAAPDLSVVKSDADASAVPGGTIAYSLAYANNGDQDATGVVLSDVVPANTAFVMAGSTAGWSCADGAPAGTTCSLVIGALAAGDNGVATFVVRVLDTVPGGVVSIGNVVNIVDDGSGGDDPTPNDNTDDEDTPLTAAPDLTVTKNAVQPVASAGGQLVYELVYANVGDQDATGVVLSETVPANTRFVVAGSTPGWSCADGAAAGTACALNVGTVVAGAPAATATFVVVLDTPLPAGVDTIANTVSIADDGTNGTDPTPENNTGTDETPITASPDLSIVKVANVTIAELDEPIAYTLTYRNSGARDATGVVLTETVPVGTVFVAAGSTAGWSCADGAAAGTPCELAVGNVPADGSDRTATFVVRVIDASEETIDNTVTVADDGTGGTDPTPEDNTDDTSTPFVAAPDLHIDKTAVEATANAGGQVTYELVYGNSGGQDATGVVLSETVPANTRFVAAGSTSGWSCADGAAAGTACSLDVGTVVAGAADETATFVVAVDEPLPLGVTTVRNTVSIADDGNNGDDPTPEDNTDNEDTPTSAAPDLSITKVANVSEVEVGDTIVYTLTYRNIGARDATGVAITETVPADTIFVAAGSTTGWSCADGAPAGTECLLDVADVPADGSSATATFVLQVIDAAEEEIVNTASIADDGASGPDPTPDNNADAVSTPVDTGLAPIDGPAVIPATGDAARALLLLMLLGFGWLALRSRR